MMFVEVSQRPERAPSFDAKTVRQASARQGLDIGLLDFESFCALIGMNTDSGTTEELVVDVGGEIKFGLDQADTLLTTFAFVPELKP